MSIIYKTFRTGDVLSFSSSKGIFHAINVTIDNKKKEDNYPYIVRTSKNNGVRGYIKEDISKLNPANTISFAQDTAQMFYQPEEYFTGNKVKILSINNYEMDEKIALFIIACLNKAFSKFVWGSSYDIKILVEVPLSLPIKLDKNNNPIIDIDCNYHKEGYIPDFDYMRDKIINLEEEIILDLEKEKTIEIEQYLSITGLNDYTLSEQDELIVKLLKNSKNHNDSNIQIKGFEVSKLFTLQKITQKLSQQDLSNNYRYPAYSSNTENNGIVGYTDKPEFICDNECPVYIIFGDHTRTLNIARESFGVLDNVKVLIPCINNEESLLFMITQWKKQIPNLGYARHWKIAKDCVLTLPIKLNDEKKPILDEKRKYHKDGYIPDWDFMIKYIKIIEKLVIKDIVKYKDTFIEQIKMVVNK